MLLIMLVMVGLPSAASHGAFWDNKVQDAPVTEVTPGLVVYGTVRDMSGVGIANVSIYRSLAVYPGVLIATSDVNGDYRSEFTYIPGDEMVTVWANHSRLVLEPERYYWRHYYGYQQKECNFLAHLRWLYYIPILTK